MKEISTFKKGNAQKDSKKTEIGPSQMTLDFLCQFARCYYVDKKLTTLRQNEFVLN